MSKNDFKKKVCKNEKPLFLNNFFETFNFIFLTSNGNDILYKNGADTIRKKVKKSDFFEIFWIFFRPFGQFLDNFG